MTARKRQPREDTARADGAAAASLPLFDFAERMPRSIEETMAAIGERMREIAEEGEERRQT